MNDHASTEDLTIMVLTSAEPTVIGNATNFSHTIRPFEVTDNANYEIAMVSIDYPSNGSTSTYVSCDIVGVSRVGSQLTNILFRIPQQPVAANSHYTQNQSIILWRPLATKAFSVVNVTLTDSSGAYLPVPGGAHTTLTVAIRRVGTVD